MKFTIFVLIFFAPQLFADCKSTWAERDKEQNVLSRCQLEWKSAKDEFKGIELVELKDGCQFPEENSENCFILRNCSDKVEGQQGASLFRKSVSADSYCLDGKDSEVFSPSKPDQPKAFIECNGKNKPVAIRLESGNGKLQKKCKFPFL